MTSLDISLARQLVDDQCPSCQSLEITPVSPLGTDNILFRLGLDMVIRLPRARSSEAHLAKELKWLPKIASTLPLDVPRPLFEGLPSEDYPFRWAVYPWLKGESAVVERPTNSRENGVALARWIEALQDIESSQGPPAGKGNFFRGVPLVHRDEVVRESLDRLDGEIDRNRAVELWREGLEARPWRGRPVWLHGDLHPGNILVREGHISGVIDFGGLAVGDPACDLMAGWSLLDGKGREVFREALQPDEATWTRGRSWALYAGLVALAGYLGTDSMLVEISRRTLGELSVIR